LNITFILGTSRKILQQEDNQIYAYSKKMATKPMKNIGALNFSSFRSMIEQLIVYFHLLVAVVADKNKNKKNAFADLLHRA